MKPGTALETFRRELATRANEVVVEALRGSPPARYTPPPPPVRRPTMYADDVPRETRPYTSTATLIDQVFNHRTRLGGAEAEVIAWLERNRVPVSPAGTVMLLKGVNQQYQSVHGTLYLPGHLVTDPDFGDRVGAGVYLCANRWDVEHFVHGRYRLMIVEAALSDLHGYRTDRRKIIARRVYVHREVPL